jgi:uncharacterized protein
MTDAPRGRFCWYELLTDDTDSAPAFYGPVTGWGAAPWEGGATPYTVWMNGETGIGGMMALPDQAKAGGAPPNWLLYVSTPDIHETTARARELGANVMMGPTELPSVGTITVMSDPHGAVFAAYQPAGETPGHDGPAAPGEVSWHELATPEPEATWSFYADLFGWQKGDVHDMGPLGPYRIFHRGAHPLGALFRKPPEMPISCWLPYVRVLDLDAAVARVKVGGGQVINGPMEVPGGDRIAQCLDPRGAMFALHQTVQG